MKQLTRIFDQLLIAMQARQVEDIAQLLYAYAQKTVNWCSVPCRESIDSCV